jgi:hypothetical protein
MPVDYTIASRNALANTPTDFTNMLAQYQMMGARAQQQQLQQLEYEKLQREMERQNQLTGILGGADIRSPAAYNALAKAGYLPEALSVMSAQEQAAMHAATAANQRGMLGIRQQMLPYEMAEKEAQGIKEQRLGKEALAKADSAMLDLVTKRTGIARDLLSNMDENNYADLKEEVRRYDPKIAEHLPENFDQKQIQKYLNTADSYRKQIEEEQKRRGEIEYVDRVNPKTGFKEKVAIRKYAPEEGGKVVPGTEGLATGGRIHSQPMPGVPGAVLQSNEDTGENWLTYPAQPGERPVTTGVPITPTPGQLKPDLRVDMTAPPGAPRNAGLTGIRAAAPLGSPERGRQDVMQQILTAGAYNPDTGVDLIEPVLGRASSGMLSAKGTDIARKFGRDSAAARADTDLKRISADLTQAFAGNRLATAGVAASEADRFEKQAGDIGNSDLTIGERLNAYRSIKRNATRLLGVEYKNPYDPQGIRTEGVMRQRVEESPNGFTVTDPTGSSHTFSDRKQATEFLTYIQRMEVGKR